MIERNDVLYIAIENAIIDIFNEDIPLNDPYETTRLVVDSINIELKEGY